MILGIGVPYRPCPVRIAQPTPGVACPHRPWTACPWSRSRLTSPDLITRGLCTTPSRRPPCPGRIGRGLNTTLHRRRPWTAHNGQPTSGVDCPHRPSLAHNGQPTSATACPHRPWTAHNGQPWTARNGRALRVIGQPTWDVACTPLAEV
ncbi:hypothetical protein KY290_013376 [Solanum tuberosum]|uniref:Uncharacterized protein n=1 Tax=Solanum tuberosum TaxID=4113 RepID=A0ABQ7VL61_SOLTU|nr:hypothetical protein KY289_015261 [Solanum tuberosum]KAH0697787.1 hypothetical protein KY289_015269 [Solanum tuberosum]KAH0697806.1 hypothetical protein KY289_015288 [Solanum tuberosum]KAH0697851.1 hypothetical protein KY289_015333 [Solanum tuberosum]KAH0768589.1 hypothetical protein KY290_012570 [Solanum tuberosum]